MILPEEISELENTISHNFHNKQLLIEALSHPSLKQRKKHNVFVKDYERLELLGDSILNFIITENLFNNYLTYDEGKLAKIRSYLVCKETISKVAISIKLEKYIIMAYSEEVSGGRSNPSNLENSLEALIAAIYLDSDIETTKRVVNKLWDNLLQNGNFEDSDPKTSLQEWAQSHGFSKPVYEVIAKAGPDHAPVFTVSVSITGMSNFKHGKASPKEQSSFTQQASGNNLKIAEKNAARKLIDLCHGL